MKAIVCLSGGIDSTVALALALMQCDEVIAVSFNYDSLHNDVENSASCAIADHYSIPWRNIYLPSVFKGHSAIMRDTDIPMPHLSYEELSQQQGPSPTVVPFRNGVFLSVAAAIAAAGEADLIYIGVHASDAHNFAYPDCTPEFIGAMMNAVYVGTYHKVRLVAPLQYMTKGEVIELGSFLDIPFDLTWSCYNPVVVKGSADSSVGIGPDFLACGECPTCIERIQAFKDEGFTDPAAYAIEINWED